MSNITQRNFWGEIDHGLRIQIWNQSVSDEYLWEFVTPDQVLENTFGIDAVNTFLAKNGGFELIDKPDPLRQFHNITLWAYHRDPKMLTWIVLQKK